MTETEFQNQILELAKLTGWLAYHTHDSRRSQPGFPDLTLVRPPRLIFAEIKTQKGRLTTEQEHWLLELQQVSGVEAQVWRPSDWDLIVKTLQR